VNAVILVGGEGTRLRPLTFTTPKSMLPVAGRPIIERVVRWLASYGVDQAVLSLGYRPDAFRAAFPEGQCAHVRLAYAVEPEPLGTAGGIAFAARQAGLDETFLVVNGDVLTDLDLGQLITLHQDRAAAATIALTPVDDPSRYGVVPTDDRSRVTAFIEKPARDEAPTNLINAGTYVLEPEVLDLIPPGRAVSIERESFPALVANGEVYALGSDAEWIDAGTPATYLEVNLAYAARDHSWVSPTAQVDSLARVRDTVVAEGVRVEAGADVKGSLLLDGAVIGPDAVVVDSIVGPHAKVGAAAGLQSLTVLGAGAVAEPGCSLSGARLPQVEP
jgi:mannose-1-phosphate guanylyltransferase